MDEYIKSLTEGLEDAEMDDLDEYIKDTIDDSNHNNNNSHNHNKHNSKSKKKQSSEPGIMDINYSDRDNSKCYTIFTDDNGTKYSIMLNQTDITYGVRGHNKFYAIQLLEHKQRGLYKFIVKWGRVGNTAQFTELLVDSKATAIAKFRKKFKDKTKNEYGDRRFVAVKGKYVPVAIADDDDDDADDDDSKHDMQMDDDSQSDINAEAENDEIPASKLDDALVRVLKIIFCKQLQLDTAMSFDYDLNRQPLGKLSKSQIDNGYGILCKINDVLTTQRNNLSKLAPLSNRYYTVIPHAYSGLPPCLNSIKRLHRESELIETLRQMMFTNQILKRRSKRKNPVDVHYKALRCDINKISKFCTEYNMICKAMKGTHAAGHNKYELKVLDVFEVNRKGSEFRHMPFRNAFEGKENGNCKMLWHGSRLSNFVGILSQGLRIAPPQAPKTGYMFGKGIYFADCVSKSANYIHATQQHPFGLLILCEVALGNVHKELKAKWFDRAPNRYHSVQGCGKHVPERGSAGDIGGYELAMGPIVRTEDQKVIDNAALDYNEYIVYDVGQVRMKYIVLTKFDFKR